MTLKDKQRLRRIAEFNARAYRAARRDVVRQILYGTATEPVIATARTNLAIHALAIAEAVATLEEHGDQEKT